MLKISCIILFEYISSLYSCSPLDAVVEIGDEERPVPDHMEMLLCVFVPILLSIFYCGATFCLRSIASLAHEPHSLTSLFLRAYKST